MLLVKGSTTEGDDNEATQTAVLAVMATETKKKKRKKKPWDMFMCFGDFLEDSALTTFNSKPANKKGFQPCWKSVVLLKTAD